MKLVTFEKGCEEVLGIVLENHLVLDVGGLINSKHFHDSSCKAVPADIMEVLKFDKIKDLQALYDWVRNVNEEVNEALLRDKVIISATELVYSASIPKPSYILAQGLAYREHLDEMGVPEPKQPLALVKAPSSLTGTERPIILPKKFPSMVDWEGEFAVVIGKTCHDVSEDEALEYVAGYTIINDVSARDWTPKALNPNQSPMEAVISWADNVQGKQFPTFTPMGPVFVTANEIENPNQLELETKVNGEVMQSANTADLIFSIEKIISHFSQWFIFQPGDIISTGSPSGVGYGMKPQKFLKKGDLIEISVEGIGTLKNRVV